MTGQLGPYDPGMHGRSAYATLAMPPVKRNGEEDVRRRV
jgi:hypothetical protein